MKQNKIFGHTSQVRKWLSCGQESSSHARRG